MAVETSHDAELTWSLVLPVKPLARAKTRMAEAAGPLRQALALAVAADTVAAALRCAAVAEVIVVTDDPLAAAELSALGARVVPDEPDCGLNPALAHGAALARAARPRAGVGAMSADLPALRPAELGRALAAAAGFAESFVADAQGVGTTLYAVRPGVPFSPAANHLSMSGSVAATSSSAAVRAGGRGLAS